MPVAAERSRSRATTTVAGMYIVRLGHHIVAGNVASRLEALCAGE